MSGFVGSRKFLFALVWLPLILAACNQHNGSGPPPESPSLTTQSDQPAVTAIDEGTRGPGTELRLPGCQFPVDTPAPASDQAAFDQYAWAMFIALSWPALESRRGEPDCDRGIYDPGIPVWRSYKFIDEIFLPGAKNPGPWNSPMSNADLAEVAKTSAVVAASPMGSVMQPVAGWLIDQKGNPTFFQIAANEVSYDYIVNNKLYDADVANNDKSIDFPAWATEIKAAWRVLTPADDRSRYLTMDASVDTFDAQGKVTGSKAATVGLVGLHIITKAPNFPQWIWSTFEQVDNLADTGGSYSDPTAPASAINQSPCQPGSLPCQPKPGSTFQTPDPLSRVTPIPADTSALNRSIQERFSGGFVEFYELVRTQRANDPDNPGNPLGTPTPNVLANTTMESYIQPTSSCMACHSSAVSGPNRYKSDFSFLFIHAQAPDN